MLAAAEREEKIRENLKLVHAIASRFKGRGIEYEDLYQAGCIGLIKSVDGFDESRGFAFSTYAVPVIMGEMRALFRSGGAIKVSRSMKEKGVRALREQESFVQSFGREPTIGELAARLGMSAEETAEVLSSNLPVLSLTGENGLEFDVTVSSHEETVEERLALKQALFALDEEERSIIEWRYFKEWTQARVAASLGTSQVQVSRKEKKAIEKLRRFLESV